MCGIGGLILFPRGPIKAEWMHSFLHGLQHRGPDDMGWLVSDRHQLRHGREAESDVVGESALFHRRLSIIDLSAAGHQPMGTADGRYWIVFNGEIYNYRELREDLRVRGHRFRSHSDTEVLLAAYVEWGVQAFSRLIGMFAFAVMDRAARRLTLVRDCFGIKPLYYASWQEGLAFASEIPPLLDFPGINRRAHPQRLFDYLHSGITDHGGSTMFEAIQQLPPAHYMDVALDEPQAVTPIRYWDIDTNANSQLSFADATKKVRELFLDGVRLHLRSDVAVGAALSGGIDSSSIVMAMRHLDRQLDLHTFSYVAHDPALSEERWADLVGTAAGAQVHKVRVHAGELAADLDQLIGLQGEPFISTSMYAQWRVFRGARAAGIKVMLDGQGADEIFAGYPSYRPVRLRSLIRQGRWSEAYRLARASSDPARAWVALAKAAAGLAPAGVQQLLRRWAQMETMTPWLNASWFRERSVRLRWRPSDCRRETFKDHLYETLSQATLPQLLHYEDRNSMACSIESRVPFLTPSLVQFVFSLPDDYLLSVNGRTKSILREAMRGIVPDLVLDRRGKLGFPTPERQWLLSMKTWVHQVLTGEAAARFCPLHPRAIQAEWAAVASGARPWNAGLWRWINAIVWAQKFSVVTD